MNPQLTIILSVLGFIGYILILSAVIQRMPEKRNVPVVSIVLLMVYAASAAALYLIYVFIGSTETSVYLFLILLGGFTLMWLIWFLIRNIRTINKGIFAIFVVYVLCVLSMTVFLRLGRNESMVQMQLFGHLRESLHTHSLRPLQHEFLNIVLFVPMGILLCGVEPRRIRKWQVLLLGEMTSIGIEMTQAMMHLGICDINDVIANLMGTGIGILIFMVVYKLGHGKY